MNAHLIGGGLASLAAAVYLIRDGGLEGRWITIYEENSHPGGALRVTGDAESGYSFPGSRVFEWQYRCAMDLFSRIPSASDPVKSIKQEIAEFNARNGWDNRSRLVDGGARIVPQDHFGVGLRSKLELTKFLFTPEFLLEGKQLKDCVTPGFFRTDLWYVWSSMMAIVPEHSAIEVRRYFLRFFHLLPDLFTMRMFLRTRYNQRQAIVEPILKWLTGQGVKIATGSSVASISFKEVTGRITAVALQIVSLGNTSIVNVEDDLVLVTNGSQLSDICVGSTTGPPRMPGEAPTARSFALWKSLARSRDDFGNPGVFTDNVDHSRWVSFTVTCRDPLFSRLMEKFSGRQAGRGGLISFKQSNWLITMVTFHQPNFIDQPSDAFVWWGYGVYPERPGNFIEKPMVDCSGAEILREVLMHLGFTSSADAIIQTSICLPCLLPFAGSVFAARRKADRPAVVPEGSTNFAFIGQFCEQPDEVIFTMEYSVRSAWTAVYKLLKTKRKPPPVYKGYLHPRVVSRVVKALCA